jgi:hypothetical protein
MPSLARFARHLRLFTIPDKDHLSPGLAHQRIKHHTAAAFHRPCASILKESYPPTPFPFSVTAHHAKHQSQRQYLPLPPCPISHRRRRIDIKAQKRANGIMPHQIPHLDYKTRNKAATIKKRGIIEHHDGLHQTKAGRHTPMHTDTDAYRYRCIQKSRRIIISAAKPDTDA